jgi:hypothetical protein
MSGDVAGGPAGCQVRFEVAVGDFERFLLVGRGASTATRQCYVRHVRAMLAEVGDATGMIDLAVRAAKLAGWWHGPCNDGIRSAASGRCGRRLR